MSDESVIKLSDTQSQDLQYFHKDDLYEYFATQILPRKLSPTECAVITWFISKIKVKKKGGPQVLVERFDYVESYMNTLSVSSKGNAATAMTKLTKKGIMTKRQTPDLMYRGLSLEFITQAMIFAQPQIERRRIAGFANAVPPVLQTENREYCDPSTALYREVTKGVDSIELTAEEGAKVMPKPVLVPPKEDSSPKIKHVLFDKESGKEVTQAELISFLTPIQEAWDKHNTREVYRLGVFDWAASIIEIHGYEYLKNLKHFMWVEMYNEPHTRKYQGQKTLDEWVLKYEIAKQKGWAV